MANPNDRYRYETFTLTGTSDSSAIDVRGYDIVGVAFPDTFTTSNVTFKASDNGESDGDFRTLSDSGDSSTGSAANKIFSAAQDTYVVVNYKAFDGVNWIKLASETSQGSARTCTLVLRKEPERV